MISTLLRSTITAVCLAALPLAALADDQAEAAERLNELLSRAQTMTGGFSQMTLSSNGANLQETTGTLALKRPGMFRWHTDPPLEQLLVSDGERIWLYDPDLQQVTIQAVDKRLSHTPALLLSGDVSQLQESFDIDWSKGSSVQDFTLTPKDADSMFDSLRVSFSDGVINDMQMSDPVGQRTNILFRNVELNAPLDDAQFTFEVPDGVDVISE
ncbi:outer membrane lipoprotein carrier protein LolA [Pseudomonas sp. G11-1]|uniref:Outer-membrane lipoprotein carrier protein n=1 Tax=Halopseudomonas bauzanensis TaxID=653930 RepID=A0A4U0YMM4_9GAMM|nr:outer membrane lipoprotein chaperone LolA [Halopseudomonas bauzanensis]MCO5787585.1 outer membrane lipoprotein carrier protein LolA [Pseudomonas sp. G11-1]MCO5790684.1 outer membrane lipoprotein carrier protein LolA [Pseudomonas sp. G11-2]TKA91466.1 outer membrane lipoprotein chaperone LolA [Halopseudomonas bauzanensis]